ncbi:MAG: TIGR01777 family protein [Zetaproteobacteria bacterium]|nr:MAG: TIGR01777 family protein [Zetaproteobacteria bacterium]
MTTLRFRRQTRIEAPAEAVYAWHARPGALERLTPPWERVTIQERTGGIEEGTRVVLRVGAGPLRLRWVAVHGEVIPGRQFCDRQAEGPFASWRHRHRFEPDGPDACRLDDDIEYSLPFGRLGSIVGGEQVRKTLDRMFAYRHAVTKADIEAHAARREQESMRVAVTGSRGLVGSALVPFLTTGGHRAIRLVRGSPSGPDEIGWDPARVLPDASPLAGIDAAVHLAGENIAAGRWTPTRKAEIRRSRVEGTRRLCESLARLAQPPKVLVSASAVGFYGDRSAEVLTEDSDPGGGFLADVCREWESATEPASQAGIRVVNLRFGMVLSPAGGALRKMLLPFRLGAGGRVGTGEQFVSWIALDDAVGVIHHVLGDDSLRGPVNAVAPGPVSNAEFARTLARVLRRPALLPLPAFAARLAFGEMADALLLSGAHVVPARLQASGYRFRFSALEGALRHLLGRPAEGESKAMTR